MDLFLLGLIFGGIVAIMGYETFYKWKGNKMKAIFAPKLEELMEMSTLRASKRRKELNRELTDLEKNAIVDECYNEI